MRTLFTFAGGTGHFLPLAGLAGAARSAGHQVAFAAQTAMLETVMQAGFEAFDTGGMTLGDPATRSPLLKPDMTREYDVVRDSFAGRIAQARAGAIIRLAEQWQPNLLVCDEMDFGAMLAAERLDLPHASILVIAAGSLTPHGLIAPKLNALRAEHGLPPDPELEMLSRYLVLTPFPPQLRDPGFPLPATAHPFRSSVPSPSSAGDTIHVTLGTVFNVESGDLFTRVLAGLSGMAADVVVAVGPQIDPSELGPQPSNIHIERFIDQSALLPRCSLVICHAGSGTVLAALANGLPMVLLPMGADQEPNARRCSELGVALVLDPIAVTPDLLRIAVAQIQADPAFRNAAARLQREIATMPTLPTALALLERLASERRPIINRRLANPPPAAAPPG